VPKNAEKRPGMNGVRGRGQTRDGRASIVLSSSIGDDGASIAMDTRRDGRRSDRVRAPTRRVF